MYFDYHDTYENVPEHTISSATAEIARDVDDVDFGVDGVHSALTLAFNSSIVSSSAF